MGRICVRATESCSLSHKTKSNNCRLSISVFNDIEMHCTIVSLGIFSTPHTITGTVRMKAPTDLFLPCWNCFQQLADHEALRSHVSFITVLRNSR